MKKTIYVLRHAIKDGTHISQEGFKSFFAENDLPKKLINELPHNISDIWCGTDIARTAETMLGFLVANRYVPEHLHCCVYEFGNMEQKKHIDEGSFEELAESHPLFNAMALALGDEYEAFVLKMCEGLNRMFEEMVGGTGLIFGHTPLIDALAKHYGAEIDENGLVELTGFAFTRQESGAITAEFIEID